MSFLNRDNVVWPNFFFMASYHLATLILLPVYLIYLKLPSLFIVISFFILSLIIGLSITAGYHRLFSHKTYQTNPAIKGLFLFFGGLAAQNSALEWSYAHRIHHANVDTSRDPYSIKKGFWHAHIMWIFKKVGPIDLSKVPDLKNDNLIMFQDRHYKKIYILGNLLITFYIGYFSGDYFGSFVFTYLLRTFFVHHMTFFINSLAHMKGKQPYSKDHSAVDNWFISFLTFGEGYHNYHHSYPSDYRNGVRWYQFDPTKWFIWSLSRVGFAKNLQRSSY